MKFKFYISKKDAENKINKSLLGFKYNKSLNRLETKDMVIDLNTGHASIGGITVGRVINKKYVLTSHVYIYNKQLPKLEKLIKALGKKIDLKIRASYGLDRLPDMLMEVEYELEIAKTKSIIKGLRKEKTMLNKILRLVVKQDKADNANQTIISNLLNQQDEEATKTLQKDIVKKVQNNIKNIGLSIQNNLKMEKGSEKCPFLYRVELSKHQALVATKKNDVVKIGFETEFFAPGLSAFASIKSPKAIFDIIQNNKSYDYIPDERCLEGIKLILALIESEKHYNPMKHAHSKIIEVGVQLGRILKA